MMLDCIHRGDGIGDVYGCAVHGECVLRGREHGLRECNKCPDRTPSAAQEPPRPRPRPLACVHRGERGRPVKVDCACTAGANKTVDTFRCDLHRLCVLAGRLAEEEQGLIQTCAKCSDRQPE